jgi:hypothetical protein
MQPFHHPKISTPPHSFPRHLEGMRYLQQSTTLHLPSTAAVITTNAHTRVVDDHAEDDFEVPQDVLEEMERERIEAQG